MEKPESLKKIQKIKKQKMLNSSNKTENFAAIVSHNG
jgi:hypothetical protein